MTATISAIEPLPRDPNVLRIIVERKTVARLSRSDVESLELVVGMPWTDALQASVDHAVAVDKARRTALSALGQRALPRSRLVERLKRRGYDEAVVATVVDELVADGWVDDAAFATAVAEQIIRAKPASEKLLVQKLISRGIDSDLAQQTAATVLDDVDPLAAATELARARHKALSAVSPQTAARRIAGLLARRGYDDETIHAALTRAGILQ